MTTAPMLTSSHADLLAPAEVSAVTAQGTITLQRSSPLAWAHRGIEIHFRNEPGQLAIDLYAPECTVSQIIFRWSYPTHYTFLGDHWERSYGDLCWAPEDPARIMPWYFLAHDGRRTQGVGVKTQCNSFASWKAGDGSLKLFLDTRCGGDGVRLGSRTLRAAEIVVMKGAEDSPFEAARRFCALMCPAPRLPPAPVYGINDWYFAYGAITREVILDHAGLLAPLATGHPNKPFCLIDAGWARHAPGKEEIPCWADSYDTPHERFGDMAALAAQLKEIGYRPGLWTRPLAASHTDQPELLIPYIPRLDALGYPLLDPSIPENLERIRNTIRTYRKWGFEMVKHDYSTADLFGKWGFQMLADQEMTFPGWHFNNTGLTTAEITLSLYRALREAAGDDLMLLGCNTVSHLSAGLFEVNRIGDDTSGKEWDRTRRMGVNTLGFRAVHHERFYSADGDCVGLTPAVPWALNKQWMQLLAGSGTPLFISAQRDAVGPEQAAFMKECFAQASCSSPVGEPLDWMETPFPKRWKLHGQAVAFDWES